MRKIKLFTVALLLLCLCACGNTEDGSWNGMEKTGSLELQYAKEFRVDYYEDGYDVITIEGDEYLLVPEGMPVPDEIGSEVTVLQQPLENLYVASSSAMDLFLQAGAIDRVFVIPDTALQRIGDAAQRTEFERGFFQIAERICGAVQAENAQAAATQLRAQLRKIAENCIGMPFPITLNLTINRFMMLLQNQLVEQNLANWRHITQADYSRTLSAAGTMEDYLAAGDQIAAELVAHARELRQDQRDGLLRAYVMENATDMNMGLTAVAREFRLKPREAAETFRAYYGESINDVIHKARVKKARELLLTTDTPVQDIASAVGYCSLATMYRAFTNVEGIAPGKLRQSRLKDRKPEDGEGE